jgi:hypothetical protein
MSIGLGSLLMLAGLAGMAIPILIHLLHRRHFDVVDWGAMQFLQLSQATRRRLRLEEVLLLLMRMSLVGLMVVALAAPFASGPLVSRLGERAGREVVLVFDSSASMGLDDGKNPTPQAAARQLACQLLDTLAPDDGVALLAAQQQVLPVLPAFTHDRDLVRANIARLPRPHGGCDGPRAVAEASRLLATKGRQPGREIVVLTDGQRQGWADPRSLLQWEQLAGQLRADGREGDLGASQARVWLVNVSAPRKQGVSVPNYALEPLRPTRGLAWVGRPLKVRTGLVMSGQTTYQPPYRIRLEADGKDAGALKLPAGTTLPNGKVPLVFSHSFAAPGAHLLSVLVEPDAPAQPGHQEPRRDLLPGDNRQDLAVEVVDHLPVLLVDGDSGLSPAGGTWFLRKALTPRAGSNGTAAVVTGVVAARDFTPALLAAAVDARRPGSRPRVLVLADVPELTEVQQQAVEGFVKDGGGLLVLPGERVRRTARFYDERLYRGGQGWLPARLEAVAGDPKQPGTAAFIDLKQSHHPALEMFRDEPGCTLDHVPLLRWWRAGTDGTGSAAVGALLSTGDPLLVEKSRGKGKVLLATIPLDGTWGSALPRAWEFPVLAHELVYYLADTRAVNLNLQAGEPLRYRPPYELGAADGGTILLFPPDGDPVLLSAARWPLVYEGARATGVYKLQVGANAPAWFVVQPDPRESDLTTCGEDDRKRLAALVPVHFEQRVQAVAQALEGPAVTADIWWLVMIAVMALLCGEVWLTRRMAANV